jgi:hypothetical protein
VHNRGGGQCEYCQTCEINIGQARHIGHINPAGGDHLDNLCLACPNCNLSKATAVTAVDPYTGEKTPLFNPRNQQWHEHFEWDDNYAVIQGITPVGRATVSRLKMNRPRIILARKRWVQAGLHPVIQNNN